MTDKYEGHDNWDGTNINMNNKANVKLIAEVERLREEVKRLREENDDSLNQIAKMATIITSIRDWFDDAPAILGKSLEDIWDWVEKND